MVEERIVVRLEMGNAQERELWERYRSLRRGRRQDWVLALLRAGLEALEAGVEQPRALPPSVRTASPKATVAPSRPSEHEPSGSASKLLGFFGETTTGQPS